MSAPAGRPRIGVLGAGNMAAALLRGWLHAGWPASHLACSSSGAGQGAQRLASGLGVRAVDNAAVAGHAELLVAAVKPQQLIPALQSCRGAEVPRLVLSVAAGVARKAAAQALPWPEVQVARAMPNLAVAGGDGLLALSAEGLEQGPRELLGQCLPSLGQVLELPEAAMDAATAVLGSGPAYVLELGGALAEAAESAGLDPAAAAAMARAVLRAAAAMVEAGEAEDAQKAGLDELVRRVTSPQGTTAAALQVLRGRGLREALREAVAAATARGAELGAEATGNPQDGEGGP